MSLNTCTGTRTPDASTPPTILSGRRVIFARAMWLLVAVLTVYVFVVGVPTTLDQALSINVGVTQLTHSAVLY